MKHDNLFTQPHYQQTGFQFDSQVADVFENMIQRSVPGYPLTLSMIGLLARQYVQEHSRVYDLGCSLGASTLAMQQNIHARHCSIIAVDNSEAMLSQCRSALALQPSTSTASPIHLICADILNMSIEQASMVVMNFTLQFIEKEARPTLLKRIYDGILPGGILVLSEKIRFHSDAEQDFQTTMHHEFKKQQGYSDLEISQKRNALEHVLVPETLQEHQQRLQDAGFSDVHVWFQCFSFVSLVAIKA